MMFQRRKKITLCKTNHFSPPTSRSRSQQQNKQKALTVRLLQDLSICCWSEEQISDSEVCSQSNWADQRVSRRLFPGKHPHRPGKPLAFCAGEAAGEKGGEGCSLLRALPEDPTARADPRLPVSLRPPSEAAGRAAGRALDARRRADTAPPGSGLGRAETPLPRRPEPRRPYLAFPPRLVWHFRGPKKAFPAHALPGACRGAAPLRPPPLPGPPRLPLAVAPHWPGGRGRGKAVPRPGPAAGLGPAEQPLGALPGVGGGQASLSLPSPPLRVLP